MSQAWTHQVPPSDGSPRGAFSITAKTTFVAFAHVYNNIFDKYKLLFYFMAYFLENLLNLRMTMSIEEHTITTLYWKGILLCSSTTIIFSGCCLQ